MRSSGKNRLRAGVLAGLVLVSAVGAQTSSARPSRAATAATIRAVRRDVLKEALRITVELDREVLFSQGRLEAPSRLFLDLKDANPSAALTDSVLTYDADVVREVRFARQPDRTTRVILDAEGVSGYSIYTLYSPYRIVVDCERPNVTEGIDSAVAPQRRPDAARTAAPAPASRAPAGASANSGGTFSVARQLGLGVSKVVIDAGHGGHDPGAAAFGISESELVLDVALRVEKLLQQRPGFETVLTRRTDEYLTLEERTDIANREAADLFLSIHANASSNPSARGVETYFLNFALNRQAEAVAARENAGSGRTMSSLPGIIKAITLNSKVNESHDLAVQLQRAMVRGLQPGNKALKDLGVKQAPFMVLIGAAMPSVLAEISFVTNRAEARLLRTPAYRQKIAESVATGIVRYQQTLKKIQTAALRQ